MSGLLISLPLFSWQQPAANVPPAADLTLQRPLERSLGPGETQVFTVAAAAGEFVNVVVEQSSVDVILSALDPAGKALASSDSPNYELGPETVSWIAAESGRFTVSVAKSPRSFETGAYRIELVARGAPGPDGNTQIEAERKLQEAIATERSADKDAAQKALPLYQDAARLWHRMSNGYEEAMCLHRIGAILSASDSAKALSAFDQALVIRRSIGDQGGQAATMNNIALVYSNQGQGDKALALFTDALSLASAAGYRSMVVRILNNLAALYDGRKEFAKELDCGQQILTLGRALNDRATQASALSVIGYALDRLGDHAKALASFQEAVAIYHALGEGAGEADALLNAGNEEFATGGKPKAVVLYEQALPLYRATGNRRGEWNVLENIGNTYFSQGDFQKALGDYQQALPVVRALGDSAIAAGVLAKMGAAHSFLGRYPDAIKALADAVEIDRAAGNRQAESDVLTSLAETETASGDPAKAIADLQQSAALKTALNDRPGLAIVANDMGVAYARLGDRAKAVDAFREGLEIRRAMGDRAGEEATLSEMGMVEYAGGDRKAALDSYEQALPLARAVGDRAGEGNALAGIGLASYDLGQMPKAVESYQSSLAIKRALGDSSGEAEVLTHLGMAYFVLGDRKAQPFYEQALAIYRSSGDHANEAGSLYQLGLVYKLQQEDQKALDLLGQALALYRSAGNAVGEASVLAAVGGVYQDQVQPSKALASFRDALSLARRSGNKQAEADALLGVAQVTAQQGDKRQARQLYQTALETERSAGSRPGEVSALSNLCSITADLENSSTALPFCQQALSVARAAGLRVSEIDALIALGDLHSAMGETSSALGDYHQAQAAAQSLPSPLAEVRVSMSLGNLYAQLGQKEEALKTYRQGLDFARQIGSRAGELVALNNLGILCAALGQPREALQRSQEALALARASGNHFAESAATLSLAYVYTIAGDTRHAVRALSQARRRFAQSGDLQNEALALMLQGFAAYKQHKTKAALQDFQAALPLTRAGGRPWNEAAALSGMCLALTHSSPQLAIFFGKQAINMMQRVRRSNAGIDSALEASFEEEIGDIYRPVAELLVQQQRFGEAEEILNLLKEKETNDYVSRDAVTDQLRAAVLLDSEKQAVERYDQIVNRIVTMGTRKSELLAKNSPTTEELAESRGLDRDLEAANTVLRRFLDDEQKQFAESSALNSRVDEFKEAEGLQDSLQKLGPDVVAIYTLVAPDKYVAMLVTSGARKAYTTRINQTDFNRKIFEFRQALQNPASNPLPLAQELYRIIFPGDLRQDLETMHANTIMWSIDGTLRYLPVAALHDGKQYLAQRFRNSLITPASLARLTDPPSGVWQGEGFGVSEAKANFRALPSVPAELNGIFKQGAGGAAPISGEIRLNADFTRQTFEDDLRSRRNRVVHVATHFDSEPGVAASSHLLLGDGTEMSLAEISAETRLFHDVDLLTLSACSTAFTNRTEDGREVDSFGAIAQRLGAKAVIASLWSVNDEATARLMETMYRLWEANPAMGKSEALRRAQVEMVTGALRPAEAGAAGRGVTTPGQAKPTDWSHPFYWAPFILIGNWK